MVLKYAYRTSSTSCRLANTTQGLTHKRHCSYQGTARCWTDFNGLPQLQICVQGIWLLSLHSIAVLPNEALR